MNSASMRGASAPSCGHWTYRDTWTDELCMRELSIFLRGRVLPLDSISVRPSVIPGAGQGLFAERDFLAGEWICVYFGRPIPLRQILQMPASELDYVMGGFGVFSIDARDEPDCIAKYINDGRNSHKANVKFIKLKRQRKAIVVAIADISNGSEFFADYGEGYWRKREEGIR
eukprot:GEMP01058189.1.p1 GENE.GEMP01058189.1~~GEMP01058189.1.p1  ORF type:complete len:172 (+),score=30.12 GEMP01058189.1:254-769(+)